MWWRRLAEVQTEHQNGEEMGFKWTWNGCWRQTAGLSISKLLIYWDFHTQPSLGFTENGPKKRKYPVSGSCVNENALLNVRGQRRMRRLVRDDRKATVTQITTRYNQGMQNTISELHNMSKPWSRWAKAAEDHTRCRSCQLRTGNGGYNLHKLTKIGR